MHASLTTVLADTGSHFSQGGDDVKPLHFFSGWSHGVWPVQNASRKRELKNKVGQNIHRVDQCVCSQASHGPTCVLQNIIVLLTKGQRTSLTVWRSIAFQWRAHWRQWELLQECNKQLWKKINKTHLTIQKYCFIGMGSCIRIMH